MSERKKEEIPGIAVAIWFGFIAVFLPLLPAYVGWSGSAVRIGSFVLAGVAFVIGLAGAATELRRLGFFEGTSWENIGYAIAMVVFAGMLHYLATVVSIVWVSVGFKLVTIIVGLIALMFLAVALGQFLVEQRRNRDLGQETSSSRTKAVGATAVLLITLLTALASLVTQIVQYLTVSR